MSCERHAGAIVDYACGAEIAAEAAAHLQRCASCQRMFAEQQRLVEGIDQELQLALEIEPSSGFVPDVLTRVQRPAFPWRTVMWWGGPAAAAAALILVVLGWPRVTEQQPPDRHDPPVLSTDSTPSAPNHMPAVEPVPSNVVTPKSSGGPPRRGEARGGVRSPRAVVEQPMHRVAADVVVPEAQSRAIARYLTLVRRGAIDTSTLVSSEGVSVDAPSELVISPISVDEIVMKDAERRIVSGADRLGPGLR